MGFRLIRPQDDTPYSSIVSYKRTAPFQHNNVYMQELVIYINDFQSI